MKVRISFSLSRARVVFVFFSLSLSLSLRAHVCVFLCPSVYIIAVTQRAVSLFDKHRISCLLVGRGRRGMTLFCSSDFAAANNLKSTGNLPPVQSLSGGRILSASFRALAPRKIGNANGAGDAFCGGFAAACVYRRPLAVCVRWGARAARLCMETTETVSREVSVGALDVPAGTVEEEVVAVYT